MRFAVVSAGGVRGSRVLRDLSEEGDAVLVDPNFLNGVEGVDAVVGAVGAEPDLEVAAARTAMQAGAPYLSAGEDPDVVGALLDLNEEAAEAGALIVAGVSWTPGVTEVLARLGAESLDEADAVFVSWALSLGSADSEAIAWAFAALSGTAVVFREGGWMREPAGGAMREVFFPEPVGWQPVGLCRGGESLSLPAVIPEVKEARVRGGFVERPAQLLHRFGPRVRFVPARVLDAAAVATGRAAAKGSSWSAARVDVQGTRAGRLAIATFGFLDHASNLRTSPAVSAALMAARGELKGTGATTLGAVVDGRAFLHALARRGIRVARLDRDGQGSSTGPSIRP